MDDVAQVQSDGIYRRMVRLVGQRITVTTAESSYSGQLMEVLPDQIRMQNELVPGAAVSIPIAKIVTFSR